MNSDLESGGLFKNLEKETLELDNDIFAQDKPRRQRPEFFMPKGTELLKVFDFLEIDMRPSAAEQTGKWPLLFFTILWNSLVIGFMLLMISSGVFPMLLFLSIFALAGLYMAWQTMGMFFNRRKVVINNDVLTSEIKPFKIGSGRQEFKTSEIEQLYVSKYFTGTTINEKRLMAYSLSAILKDKRSVRIISNSNLETALYLEQEIERFLDIEDKPVTGEILK